MDATAECEPIYADVSHSCSLGTFSRVNLTLGIDCFSGKEEGTSQKR